MTMSSTYFIALFLLSREVPCLQNKTTSKSPTCPVNWVGYRDSCYYFENRTLSFERADQQCSERGATLFVADSLEEWNKVLSQSSVNSWWWVGIQREEDDPQPSWEESGGIPVEEINWLQDNREGHQSDWNSMKRCVAVIKSRTIPYAHFHHCEKELQSICERNKTVLSRIWDDSWEQK